MNIFFSGIGGVGLGPLAMIASGAGHTVSGSDLQEGLMTNELRNAGVNVSVGAASDTFLRMIHEANKVDWLVYTAALPLDHPELIAARELGIRTSKRDELLAHIIEERRLKLLAVSGSHGKTSTSGMLVWALKQLDVPVSYSIGTTLPFGPSGLLDVTSEYFVYECDEFDRNMLHFNPHLSIITSLEHDHVDTYPAELDYYTAFGQFTMQSNHTIGWRSDLERIPNLDVSKCWLLQDDEVKNISLAGAHNRRNGTLVTKSLEWLGLTDASDTLSSFPGTNRRFEKLADNLYSDYGHHPTEIAATLQMAREISDKVVLIYQPHQNTRQHEVRSQYANCFTDAEQLYWLPTYLTREHPDLPVLSPEELSHDVTGTNLHIADMDEALWLVIQQHRAEGHLVLCMGAGSIDGWVRSNL